MIGWEQETLQVGESVEQARICFRVLQGRLGHADSLAVNITTRDGTATRGGQGFQQDYSSPILHFFILFYRICTNIFIVDDLTLDSAVNETFFVDLLLVDVVDRVTISPSTVVVSIIDDEGRQQ